ncbi:MAG: hypothetical protein WCO90_12370, partial [Planctomycetota bacterium]
MGSRPIQNEVTAVYEQRAAAEGRDGSRVVTHYAHRVPGCHQFAITLHAALREPRIPDREDLIEYQNLP